MRECSWPRRIALLGSVCLFAAGQGLESSNRELPEYTPRQKVAGVIRIWGHGSRNHDFIGGLLSLWEQGFRKYQPGVSFSTELFGNASAIGGLYTGAADVAFMGREIWPIEKDGYEQGMGYEPFGLSIANGSVANPNHDFALVIFVNGDNPLSKLSLVQLDAIFGADHKRGPKNIRTWADLGSTGEWADHPIHLYGYGIDRDFSQFFETAVFAGSRKWNCSLHQFADGQQIVDALAKDRYGIAFSSLAYKNAMVKPIALSSGPDTEPYFASEQIIIGGQYPLARTPYMFVNHPSKQPMDANVKEFLLYVLSREGQQAVLDDGGYLPLSAEAARKQRDRLLQ